MPGHPATETPKTAAMIAAEVGSRTGITPEEAAGHQSKSRRQMLQEEMDRASDSMEEKQAELRKPLYEDVETLLMTGFLSHQVTIAGTVLSLRSLSPGDLFLLRHRARGGEDREWKAWTVATSVWMVNGILLLGDPHAPVKMWETLRYLPEAAIDIPFSIVTGMFNRVGTALRRTEAYCYESYSRVNWRLCGRQSPAREDFTGIPGSGQIGLNHAQRMWLAFNLAEDDRLDYLQQWQSAKLVASATSPKGIRRLNHSDDNLRQREERRRKDAIQRMVQESLYGKEPQGPTDVTVMVRGQPVVVPYVKTARSADELAEQMRAWVAGEKDWHDIVVDTYKNRIREQFAKERAIREQRLAEAQQQPQDEPGTFSQSVLVGYTPDQIREVRPDLFGRKAGTKQVFDGSTAVSLYHKYLTREVAAGKLEADEYGVREGIPEEEAPPPSLQDRVGARRPAFSTPPMKSHK